MASTTPRASGFWMDARIPSHYPEDEGDVEQQSLLPEQEGIESDGRTPVCRIIVFHSLE